ncbi:MAG: ABC transporter ATP-binding protein [Candidatus Nezhaarchaeota archaeon]|nr:ABC transporter ATP-binding protein [Candidatus Nezhaarchaeota archaeon]MCX8142524.1 ABC transporter ATP-binding protein [Candidatus Nezhaarchaeota archaeon]MDW8050503.1 ABC transporter ATP-binding protein [Nitrososphaerota archaeon]
MKTLIEAQGLRTWFPIKTRLLSKPKYVRAVDGVDITIHEGETLAVVGESGCGKTTLGKTLLRIYRPFDGKILYRGRDITYFKERELKWYRRKAQMIHQDPFSSLNPFFNVRRILEEPLIIHRIGSKEEREERVYRVLEDVKLTPVEDFVSKYPHMLSGGQRQRVAIARALILEPEFVVADEPVSMLDASVRIEILYLLHDLQDKYGISFMYITHDIATAKYFSNRIAVMYAGKIIELGQTRKIIEKPLHPYSQALIEAIPDPDPSNRFKMRKIPPGEPPDLINPPSGCRFAPRCPFRTDKCELEPPINGVEPNHFVSCWLYGG